MKIAKVSSKVRYIAHHSPANRLWYVVRQVLDRGQWVQKPSVTFRCESRQDAETKVDKQAALERNLIKEILQCIPTYEGSL